MLFLRSVWRSARGGGRRDSDFETRREYHSHSEVWRYNSRLAILILDSGVVNDDWRLKSANQVVCLYTETLAVW